MDDDVERPRTSFDEDKRRTAAASAYEQAQRDQREQTARTILQRSPVFSSMMREHGVEDERAQQLVIEAVAKEIAEKRAKAEIDPKELGRLIEVAAPKAFEQERLEREQTVLKDIEQEKQRRQQELSPPLGQDRLASQPQQHERADYFARNEPRSDSTEPTPQWLGKYQALEDTARQQREESDKRQTLSPSSERVEREPTEQEHKAARTEQTDRKQARNPESEALMQRRKELMELYGRATSEATRERDQDGGIER